MFVFFIFFVSRPSNLSAIGRPEAALRIDQSSIALSMSAGGPSVPVTALPGLLAHAQASHHVQSADGLSGPTTALVAPASHHSPQGGGAAPPSPSMACALTPASALVAQASHQSPQGGGAARPTPSRRPAPSRRRRRSALLASRPPSRGRSRRRGTWGRVAAQSAAFCGCRTQRSSPPSFPGRHTHSSRLRRRRPRPLSLRRGGARTSPCATRTGCASAARS